MGPTVLPLITADDALPTVFARLAGAPVGGRVRDGGPSARMSLDDLMELR